MDLERLTELMMALTFLIAIPGVPLYLAYYSKKQTQKIRKKERETGEYTYKSIPMLVEGNRDNVVRVCIVIDQNKEEKRNILFSKEIGKLIKYNIDFYHTTDPQIILINDGSVLYEYLIVDKTTAETKEISGVANNYYEIQSIIDEIKRH